MGEKLDNSKNPVKLEFKDISKHFAGVNALKNVSVSFRQGEIHGLVGKNGAGKSTFVSIVYGSLQSDRGNAWIKNEESSKEIDLKHFNPIEARKNGIFLVPQEPPFALDLSIEENFFLQRPLMKNLFLDKARMHEEVKKTLSSFNMIFDPDTKIRDVPVEDRHLLYTAMVIDLFNGNIILLDEVTSALRKAKTEILFNYLKKIKNGKTVILITHRVPEIFEICDVVTVFRNGEKIVTENVKNLDEQGLSNLIVGEKVEYPNFDDSNYIQSDSMDTILKIENLNYRETYKNISISLRKGEILGITGLVDSGTTEIFRSICGIHPVESGKIIFNDENIEMITPEKMMKNGVVYCTNDRINEGLFDDLTILDNMNICIWNKIMGLITIDQQKENESYEKNKSLFNIKSSSPYNLVKTLSGGNQQKVILSRLINVDPVILILDEPTKGIDIGAKYEILKLLRKDIATKNIGVIINSSSIEELIIVCDKIITVFQGEIKDVFDSRKDFSEHSIFRSIQGG